MLKQGQLKLVRLYMLEILGDGWGEQLKEIKFSNVGNRAGGSLWVTTQIRKNKDGPVLIIQRTTYLNQWYHVIIQCLSWTPLIQRLAVIRLEQGNHRTISIK